MHAAGHYIFPANFGPERLAEHRDDRVDRSPWRSYVPIALKPPGESDFDVATLGVSMATKLWASRLAEYGIDVYEVRPSIISTDMTAGVTKKYDSLIEHGLTLDKRWGTPEDVATVISVLARGDLPYATGQVLTIDGGLTVPRL